MIIPFYFILFPYELLNGALVRLDPKNFKQMDQLKTKHEGNNSELA